MADLQRSTGSGWKYTLTGFGEFLEMRRVTFVEPVPATRLCSACGVLPCRTALLPCGHVFCESCKAKLPRGDDCQCPFDGKKFAYCDVHPMTIERRELEQRRIVCSASSRVCRFTGKLSELADHLTQCGGGKVKCCKCQRPVYRDLAVDHLRGCTRRPLCVSNDEEAASEGDVSKMADVDRNSRELVPSQGVSLEAAMSGCCASALADRVASLEREFLEVQKKSGDSKEHSVAAAGKDAVIQGPFRPASKAGVLITTCKFADIYARLDSLNDEKKELTISTDAYSLGGYTFRIGCKFSRDGNETSVAFAFFLRDGEWDGYLEWPFQKKVTLLIMYPWEPLYDAPLRLTMVDHDTWKLGNWTANQDWKIIERQGYVTRGALYINVEFE